MNILFFKTAMVVYLLSAAGYIWYIIKPETKWAAKTSLWAAFTGFALHVAYFSFRWAESGRIPVTSFFEAANFLGMGIMLVFLIMELRFKIAALGSFMLPLVLLLMLPAFAVSGDIKELNPVLKSGWLGVHTSFAVLGDAAFAFAFIVAVMYLIQEHQLKAKRLGAIFHRLPSLDIMDTLGYKALTFGWPLFTVGMITGSIWANRAWGTYWSWDPKETWSLITWVIYLALLHLRTIGWRGRKMAFLSILGFAFVLVSFFIVSRVNLGKHTF
ncbi:MAG: c-type cytochrome biogenesis protein CcsB [Nitrospirae bacterium GWD2_57_9]|nr:MAG: c-type cytochrome biogenesis protein CcsB [Nitrospirae bacterium GWD2_57_9]